MILGLSGFETAEEAVAKAKESLVGLQYAIVKRIWPDDSRNARTEFGWVYPVEYAEQLVRSGNATIVNIEEI